MFAERAKIWCNMVVFAERAKIWFKMARRRFPNPTNVLQEKSQQIKLETQYAVFWRQNTSLYFYSTFLVFTVVLISTGSEFRPGTKILLNFYLVGISKHFGATTNPFRRQKQTQKLSQKRSAGNLPGLTQNTRQYHALPRVARRHAASICSCVKASQCVCQSYAAAPLLFSCLG